MNCDRLVGKAKIKFLKDLIAKLDIDEETFAPTNWMNQKKCDLRYYMTQQQQIGIVDFFIYEMARISLDSLIFRT